MHANKWWLVLRKEIKEAKKWTSLCSVELNEYNKEDWLLSRQSSDLSEGLSVTFRVTFECCPGTRDEVLSKPTHSELTMCIETEHVSFLGWGLTWNLKSEILLNWINKIITNRTQRKFLVTELEAYFWWRSANAAWLVFIYALTIFLSLILDKI